MEWQWNIIKKCKDCIVVRLLNTANGKYIKWIDINENYFNTVFINSFIKFLVEFNPFDEFYIEFNPITFNQINHTVFEFVLIKTFGFASNPDINTFGIEKLNTNSNDVIWFPNPSNTALLVVPCYNHNYPMDDYTHIGKFIKSFNIKQKRNLIIKMFELYFKLLKQQPGNKLWLSTHGKGVAWLHIRIDKTPRYISWNPYK